MKSFTFLVTIAVLLTSAFADDEYTTITAENYDAFMAPSMKSSAITFFCIRHHEGCRRINVLMHEIKEKFSRGSNLKFGMVNVEKEYALVDRLGIRTIPGVTVQYHKTNHTYSGESIFANVIKALNRVFLDRTVSVNNKQQMEKFLETRRVGFQEIVVPVLGYFPDEESDTYHSFVEATHDAMFNRYFTWGVTKNVEFMGGDQPPNTIALFLPEGRNPRVAYLHNAVSAQQIMEFVGWNGTDLVEDITDHTIGRTHVRNSSILFFFVDKDVDNSQLTNVATEVAAKFFRQVSVVTQDKVTSMSFIRETGLSGMKYPAVAMQHGLHAPKWFPFPEDKDLSTSEISTFIEQLYRGELRHFIRSEEIPQVPLDPTDNLIKAVGLTVEDLVFKSQKRFVVIVVLSEFCTLCEKSLQSLALVRARLVKPEEIDFIKFDPVNNHIPNSLMHDYKFPGYIIRDNQLGRTTVASGRKVTVKAIEHFFETFFPIKPSESTEGEPLLTAADECWSTTDLDEMSREKQLLDRMRVKLVQEIEQVQQAHRHKREEL
eukprot:PhF_6_TR29063/c1_g1_i1/m.42351/K09580/PDIA1, P4HB; protein disulfide-isomerase A1